MAVEMWHDPGINGAPIDHTLKDLVVKRVLVEGDTVPEREAACEASGFAAEENLGNFSYV